jgi:hypothetical protein
MTEPARASASVDPPKADTRDLLSRGYEPVTAFDWFMVVLGAANVLMLIVRDAYASVLPTATQRLIVGIDLAIVALFALEFLVELKRSNDRLRYIVSHWYDAVGLIPISNWWLRSFRLVRLLRIYVVKHFPAETQPGRTWVQAFVRGVIGHYRDVLLEEITDPIILASLDTLQPPLVRSRFAETLGETLEERRDQLRYVVEEAVSNARGLGAVMSLPKGRELVRGVTDSALDAVIETLKSDEINEVISEAIRDVLDEVRERVAEKEYQLKGTSRLIPRARPAG